MKSEPFTKRGLFIGIVVVTIAIFVALVWLIATRVPWGSLGLDSPTSTLSLQVARNCTYPLPYWAAHPELFPAQVIIGGVPYGERELEALLGDDSQELAQELKSQLAVAFLNGLAGADQGALEATVFDAYGWLVRNPAGSAVTYEESQLGRQLLNNLLAYNLGLAGVESCASISGASLTATAAGQYTASGSQAITLTLTTTLTEAVTPTGAYPTGVSLTPTRTPLITTQRAANASPTATSYSPPQPTNTSRPPEPTNTLPPPTATLPPPPTPTDTPKPTLTLPPPNPTVPGNGL